MSTQQATLHVSGMTCNNCTRFVDNTLRDLAGVETTNVSLENGTAQVQFDADLLNLQQIIEAINDTHFSVERVEQ